MTADQKRTEDGENIHGGSETSARTKTEDGEGTKG